MIEPQQRVAELFAAALDLETDEQATFLARECDGQPVLLERIKSLLNADARVAVVGFLHGSALNTEARQYANELEEETRIGQLCGHYKILSLIGEGGMGEVYLAEDTVLERKVALKLIKGGFKTKEVLRRFHNERQILANLQHPNIARLLDGGTTEDGLPFFVMEYVEGQAIDAYADVRELSITERLNLFRTVCSAINYAHQNLVIHRDIKPSNILVTTDGTPKLLDFGIAKLFDPTQSTESLDATATLMCVMTPEYASPEQVKGETITTASDVYSLGVLLYELLTGQRPYRFKSSKPDDVASAICTEQPERPSNAISHIEEAVAIEGTSSNTATSESVSRTREGDPQRLRRRLRGDLDNIILMALRKEPARRYASVSDFSEDIHRHLEGLPVRARKDTFTYRASKFVNRNKVALAAAAVILLTLIGGIIATAWEAHVARAERARAERRFNDVRRMADSFLFELNDEIQKGPTKARELLVKKALEYLDSLAQETGSDRSLQRDLATAYIKVGDIQGMPYNANLGDTAGALTSNRKAADILESLAASEPEHPENRKLLSLAYENIGKIQMLSNDYTAAAETHQKAISLRESLLAAEPQNKEYSQLVAASYMSLGDSSGLVADVSGHVDDFPRVLEYYRKALRLSEELIQFDDPTKAVAQRSVATLYQRIGTRLNNWGNETGDAEKYRQAIDHHRQSLGGWESLSASRPDDTSIHTHIADELIFIGISQSNLGEVQEALENYRKAQDIINTLIAKDSTNTEFRYEEVFLYQRIAIAFEQAGDISRAIQTHRQAVRISEELLTANPTRIIENYDSLKYGDKEISKLLEKQGDIAGAIENRRKELEIIEKYLDISPDKTRLSSEQSDAETQLGKLTAALAVRTKSSSQR